jgi:nitrogen regulatory protein P-II
MSAPIETAKLKLITIIASSEMSDSIEEHLKVLGATGYTLVSVDGRGLHGPRRAGLFTLGNVRIETLVHPAVAHELLQLLGKLYADRALTAFSQDVEAIPRDHFVRGPVLNEVEEASQASNIHP